jgi:hypothetical protein
VQKYHLRTYTGGYFIRTSVIIFVRLFNSGLNFELLIYYKSVLSHRFAKQ